MASGHPLATQVSLLKQLAEACRDGRVEAVREILRREGAAELKWEASGQLRHTPLMWAAEAGHLGVVNALLEGEDKQSLRQHINMKSWRMHTALFLACLGGHRDVASFLIEKGAEVKIQDADKVDMLTAAASRGHAGVVRWILRAEALLHREDGSVHPARLQAVVRGHTETLKALLTERGATWTIDIRDSLMGLAGSLGQWGCKLVLEAVDRAYLELFHAIQADNVDALAALVQQMGGGFLGMRYGEERSEALEVAATLNRTKALLWMLQRPGVTLRVDERGNAYALHGAAQAGSQEAVVMLLEHGASPVTPAWTSWEPGHQYLYSSSSSDERLGRDAVLAAIKAGHVGILRLLLERVMREPIKNAKHERAMDRMKCLALARACDAHQEAVAQVLLRLTGADHTKPWYPYTQNNQSKAIQAAARAREAFHRAVAEGKVEVVRQLLTRPGSEDESIDSIAAAVVQAVAQSHWVGSEQEMARALLSLARKPEVVGKAQPPPPTAPLEKRRAKLGPTGRLLIDSRVDSGRRPLMVAADKELLEMARLLLEHGAQPNLAGGGVTALRFAVMQDDEAMVRLLLEHGASTLFGEPLLQVAAENAGARVVRLLLEHHESEAYDEDLLSVSLTVACEAANEPVVDLLVSFCESKGFACFSDSQALETAARMGSVAIVERLLPWQGEGRGLVHALLAACEACQVEVVRVLLDAGGDVLAHEDPCPDEDCPYGWEASCYHRDVTNILQEAESDRQVLVTAAMRGYVEVAARMLGVYWPSDWQARAVLMDGEQRARARKRLVNGGCRLEDRARWTPMMAAASTGQVDMMWLLHLAGADVCLSGGDEQTALYVAAEHGMVEAVELLVMWGAEVVGPSLAWDEPIEIFDVTLRDPVTAASRAGHALVVRKLLQLAPNAPFPRIDALFAASDAEHVDCVLALLQGAPRDVLDCNYACDGISVLDWSVSRGHTQVLVELLAWGGSLPEERKKRKLPVSRLTQLRQSSNRDIVVVLERRLPERAMLLCKARCIHDAAQPSARHPPALQHRTTALPSVVIGSPAEMKARQTWTEMRLEVVLAFVIKDLKFDLFEELMELLVPRV